MNKDVSKINKPSTTYEISENEIRRFSYLTGHGLDVMTGIRLCFSQQEKILSSLRQGKKFSEIIRGHNSDFFRYISVLSNYISLQDCVECVHTIESGQNQMKKTLLKQSVYPLFLIGFSYFLILFFTLTILPAMQVYLNEGTMNLVHALFFFYSLILIAVVAALFLYFFGQRIGPVRKKLFEWRVQKQITTYEFCILYRQLHRHGLTSMECVQAIEKMGFNPFVSYTAKRIRTDLSQGHSFLQCVQQTKTLDPSFVQFLNIGMQSGQPDSLLKAYEGKTLDDLTRWVKRTSGMIQIFSYIMVAVLIFVFYQIMMVPLNLLETF
ncbi:MAG: type II secretion system F family protein [Erysipelotrichaceae bacterium]|nr:type II secretion system F family protein [Erysipelotrichaceae bacterium]